MLISLQHRSALADLQIAVRERLLLPSALAAGIGGRSALSGWCRRQADPSVDADGRQVYVLAVP